MIATYAELAHHYGAAVLPARPRKSKDKAKLRLDYHIEFNRRFYSVPHALVGEEAGPRITATLITVLHKGKQPPPSAPRLGAFFCPQSQHMPESQRRQ